MDSTEEKNIILGTYQILSLLGRGTFGEVYKVRVLKGRYRGKMMALKVARNAEVLPYLWREVQTLLLFNHPHIISLQSYLYKKDRGELYVLYELMDVGDLKDYVVSNGKLPEENALKVLLHVAKGLEFLHSRGYIHGDVKPENIFGKRVLRDVVWKLGDFGLVRIRGSESIIDVKGTTGYIAPEVFRGEIHRSSDIFSLGCVLHFMLTGRDPFECEDRKEKLKRNKEGTCTIEDGLSERIKTLLHIMLSKDPTKRFRTAKELIEYMIRERLA